MRSFRRMIVIVAALVLLSYNGAGSLDDDDYVFELCVPSLGITVPVFKIGPRTAQEIVDEDNAAAIIEGVSQNIIADHRSQAFYNLPSAVPGKTVAYVRGVAFEHSFVCVYTKPGQIIENARGGFVLLDGEGFMVSYRNRGGLCMYTCLGSAMENGVLDVMVTYWQPVVLKGE